MAFKSPVCTVVIILNIGLRVISMVVGSVRGEARLDPEQDGSSGGFAVALRTKFTHGLSTLNTRLLIAVDIARLMLSNKLASVDAAFVTRPTVLHAEPMR